MSEVDGVGLIGRDGPRIAAELRAEQAEADAEHWRSEAMRHVERIGVIEQQLQGAVEALRAIVDYRSQPARRAAETEREQMRAIASDALAALKAAGHV